MVANKRGWMRIMEATIAIMLVAGVLLVAYSKHSDSRVDSGAYIHNLQKSILNEIALRSDLRSYVLATNTKIPEPLSDFVSSKIPSSFNHSLRICNLEIPPTPCKLSEADFISTMETDVFVEEIIISSNITAYNPKKVRLFVWGNRKK